MDEDVDMDMDMDMDVRVIEPEERIGRAKEEHSE